MVYSLFIHWLLLMENLAQIFVRIVYDAIKGNWKPKSRKKEKQESSKFEFDFGFCSYLEYILVCRTLNV